MIKIAVVIISIVIIALGAWHFSRAAYVGADKPHWPITTWILNGAMERSVKYHSKSISPPPTNDSLARLGFRHFHSMCVMCHGAPGFEPSEIGKGLTPPPPNLQKALAEWNSTETYWIVQHGIKMTGMPSFGVTHSKKELIAIVSFLQQFPTMSTDTYAGLVSNIESEYETNEVIMPKQDHGHVHKENEGHEKHSVNVE